MRKSKSNKLRIIITSESYACYNIFYVLIDGVITPPGDKYDTPYWDDTFDCEGIVEFRWYYKDCADSEASWSWFYEIDMPEFELPQGPFGEVVACPDDAKVQPEIPFYDYCGVKLLEEVDEAPYYQTTHTPFDLNGPVTWTIWLKDCTGLESHYRSGLSLTQLLMKISICHLMLCKLLHVQIKL